MKIAIVYLKYVDIMDANKFGAEVDRYAILANLDSEEAGQSNSISEREEIVEEVKESAKKEMKEEKPNSDRFQMVAKIVEMNKCNDDGLAYKAEFCMKNEESIGLEEAGQSNSISEREEIVEEVKESAKKEMKEEKPNSDRFQMVAKIVEMNKCNDDGLAYKAEFHNGTREWISYKDAHEYLKDQLIEFYEHMLNIHIGVE
uniref:Chromo domain-containing protein n=1 Tax=Ascaris lumbricoides TaxID=6252 RepID=A0A0M3IB47_ASCLU